MAKMKNAPNAGRVSLYVPADNKYENMVSWYSFRKLCDIRGTSVFRELIKFIQRDLNENPPTAEQQHEMHEFVKANGLDPNTKSPISKSKPQKNTDDLSSFSIG